MEKEAKRTSRFHQQPKAIFSSSSGFWLPSDRLVRGCVCRRGGERARVKGSFIHSPPPSSTSCRSSMKDGGGGLCITKFEEGGGEEIRSW